MAGLLNVYSSVMTTTSAKHYQNIGKGSCNGNILLDYNFLFYRPVFRNLLTFATTSVAMLIEPFF